MHTLADHHLMALVNEGLWEQLLKKYEPVKSCGDFRIDESFLNTAGDQQLQAEAFIGPSIVVFVGIVLSWAIKLCRAMSRVSLRRRAMALAGKDHVKGHASAAPTVHETPGATSVVVQAKGA